MGTKNSKIAIRFKSNENWNLLLMLGLIIFFLFYIVLFLVYFLSFFQCQNVHLLTCQFFSTSTTKTMLNLQTNDCYLQFRRGKDNNHNKISFAVFGLVEWRDCLVSNQGPIHDIAFRKSFDQVAERKYHFHFDYIFWYTIFPLAT